MSMEQELQRLLDERGVEYYRIPTISGACFWFDWVSERGGYTKCVGVDATGCYAKWEHLTPAQAITATFSLDQPPYRELIEVLRRDWGIEVSWDGLRRFWYVGRTDERVEDVGREKPRPKLYTLELSDSLLDYSYPDGNVYLTREAAERRAARMTYSDDCVEYWARVVELECHWNVEACGPWNDGGKSDWLRFIDYASNIKRERDEAAGKWAKADEQNHRLADLVADMLVTVRAAGRLGVDVGKVEEYGRRASELGIEVYG